jgi:sialidase-1
MSMRSRGGRQWRAGISVGLSVTWAALATAVCAAADPPQRVEGFDGVVFHHNANGATQTRDFRGPSRGYMTAGWWAPGQIDKNYVSWKTAVVPDKKPTTFAFIGATAVLPSSFTRGPSAKLTVNGQEAVTFTVGYNQDRTWKEGDYELKYISKRSEFPYFGSHRQLRELHGNSGVFELTVPAAAVEPGKAVVIQVEMLPFEGWDNGWFMVKERRDVLNPSIESVRGEIETLRQDVNVLNRQTHVLATRLYEEFSGAARFEHHVLYRNGFRHLHPADLIRRKNGELLLLSREGNEHISNDGDVIMLRSSDNGKTWGDKQTIANIKDLDEREGCGIELSDGTIIVGIFYNNLYGPDGAYKSGHRALLTELGKHYLGTYIITSKDGGKSWSAPKYLETEGMPFTNIEGPTDAPIEMPDGSVVMAVIGYSIHNDPDNRSSVLVRSTDKGQSWKYVSTIASDPGGKLGGFMEPGIVRTKSGRIVAALRNHGPDNAIWTTFSDDDGKTWAPVEKTLMIGHPVDLLQLPDGRVMATYGIRNQHALPGGIRACFSEDDGKTWNVGSEVQIRNDFFNWDVGYPESINLPDGQVLTVYYGNLFNEYFLGGTFWRP